MTEQEAKTKWCPMVRVFLFPPTDNENYPINRGEGNNTNCVASNCMMWRWYSYKAGVRGGESIPAPITEDGGFCGIGGE